MQDAVRRKKALLFLSLLSCSPGRNRPLSSEGRRGGKEEGSSSGTNAFVTLSRTQETEFLPAEVGEGKKRGACKLFSVSRPPSHARIVRRLPLKGDVRKVVTPFSC